MQTNKDLPTAIVAGGTGGIGRTIVEELVRQGKYNVVVFSRTVRSVPSSCDRAEI